MNIVVTSFEKKGPILTCGTNDGRAYKIDFSKGKAYGITGKQISTMNAIITKIPCAMQIDNIFYQVLVLLNNTINPTMTFYSTVESLLSYPDLLKGCLRRSFVDYLIAQHGGKLPKGYVVWCRKNNICFDINSIQQFDLEQRLKTWPRSLVDTAKKITEGMQVDLLKLSCYEPELCMSLIRIINNSIKRYELAGLNSALCEISHNLETFPFLRKYLDDTKCAKVASQILMDIRDKERNTRILQNEARIAALNGIVINDNIVIKVPSTMDDFVDEGNQQHNCVGHYYHNSMAAGDCIIYFLRRKEEPDTSYVTCRFDIKNKHTVEHRLIYNHWYTDMEVIVKIDKMIREILY